MDLITVAELAVGDSFCIGGNDETLFNLEYNAKPCYKWKPTP